jgi:hypothetical protein
MANTSVPRPRLVAGAMGSCHSKPKPTAPNSSNDEDERCRFVS